MSGIFDTHAHYDDEKFNEDRAALLSSLPSKGVELVMNCATNPGSIKSTLALAKEYDFIYAAIGFHPEDLIGLKLSDLETVKTLALQEPKVKAIGEIGLDYYWKEVPRETQLPFFETQIELAKALGLPVIVHDREAHEDTYALLRKHKPKGVLHCYSGSAESAKEILDNGMYIGIGGALTFKNAKKVLKVAEYVPLERILLETDAPYMAPVPCRGKRNDSSLIAHVAEKLAEIKGISTKEVIDTCNRNGRELFHIDK
ncbi:MAG: TatD family deoxyribonuclease [Ruminococcaceae bacterium]|nr:TatD family deoxyribonuclease [Oscillospiraceae bacterium]